MTAELKMCAAQTSETSDIRKMGHLKKLKVIGNGGSGLCQCGLCRI